MNGQTLWYPRLREFQIWDGLAKPAYSTTTNPIMGTIVSSAIHDDISIFRNLPAHTNSQSRVATTRIDTWITSWGGTNAIMR